MPEFRGSAQVNIKGRRLMVTYTLSGHVPSEEDGKWAAAALRPHVSQALAEAPDLQAAAADPTSVAQAAMGQAIPTLMQRGVAGVLTIDSIRGPGLAAPPPAAAPAAALAPTIFEMPATIHGEGGFQSFPAKVAFHGDLSRVPKDALAADVQAVVGFALMKASSLEEASEKLQDQMAGNEFLEMFKVTGRFEILEFAGPLGGANAQGQARAPRPPPRKAAPPRPGPLPPNPQPLPNEHDAEVTAHDEHGNFTVSVRWVFEGTLAEWPPAERILVANVHHGLNNIFFDESTPLLAGDLPAMSRLLNDAVDFAEARAQGHVRIIATNLAPPAAAPAPANAPAPAPAIPAFEPEQFASLDVELDMYPGHEAAILTKYGVAPEAQEALATEWRSKLADPALKARYQAAYDRYKTWLQSQQPQ